jgi:Fe-S cluster assembly protein SufD
MQSLSSHQQVQALLKEPLSPLGNTLFWRHCDLKKLLNQDWALLPMGQTSEPMSDQKLQNVESVNPDEFVHAIVFINGQYCQASSYHEAGIHIASVSSQSTAKPTHAKEYLASLNAQLPANTYQIQIASEARVKHLKIIHVVHVKQPTFIPFNLKLHVEAGFEGSLEFHAVSRHETSVWINQCLDVEIGCHAKLTVYEFFDQTKNLSITHTSKVNLGEKSNLTQCVAHKHFSALYYQQDIYLNGFMANWRIHGFSILKDQQKSHYRFKAHHIGKKTVSKQFMRGLLNDQAYSLWESSVIVHQGATQSDSSQMNNHLLLGEKSKALSIPILEIDEDDVACSHGSTVGALDETMLFYLQSRGLSAEKSLSLMKRAFIAEVLIHFDDRHQSASLKPYKNTNE